MGQWHEATNGLAAKHMQANWGGKTHILDQLVELTGWQRDRPERRCDAVAPFVPRPHDNLAGRAMTPLSSRR